VTDRDEFDRVSDVAQGLSPAGLVQDAVDLGNEGGGVCGQEDFTAGCGGGYSGGEVDRGADVAAVSLDSRSVVHSDPHGRRAVAGKNIVSDPQSEEHGLSGVVDAEHERVPDGLDLRSPNVGSSARTASQNSATRIAACSSPCASVSEVRPAMAANMNVAVIAADSPVGWRGGWFVTAASLARSQGVGSLNAWPVVCRHHYGRCRSGGRSRGPGTRGGGGARDD
jgi:hypothetical protein